MNPAQSQASQDDRSPRETARDLLVKDLGVGAVADWCSVSEAAVYQWISRGDDETPIPPVYVPRIIAGARAAGKAVSLAVLWPALNRVLEEAA
ncbi:MAG TPA: hypothetical protein VFA22_10475 [Stellaceae bacterium]|nr:hypothetical protein [Stellaceae bacterium]